MTSIERRLALVVAVATLCAGAALAAGPPASAAGSYSETTGGATHTWTNYSNAGGYQGPVISSNQAVQVECYVIGHPWTNGNAYWYKIASAPWSGQYYASADAFYNNGATSGSLRGTPWVDPAVPKCGSTPAPPPPPTPSRSVSLAQGPAAPDGYRYAISLSGFGGNSSVSISCRDSADPSGFYDFSLKTNGSGGAFTQGYCYSNDGPDHWVVANGVESNHVSWGARSGGASGGGGGGASSGGGGSGAGSSSSGTNSPGSGASGSGSGSSSGSKNIGDPCIARYRAGGSQHTQPIFGGSETSYDRTASLYQQCEGFGAPQGLHFSAQMKCALIAAAATYGGPAVNIAVSRVCDSVDLAASISQGDFLGAASGQACGFFSDIFAKGVGILAAGASSETGPGAVAVGVATYKALSAYLKVACGGLLEGGANAVGQKLEADHETAVSLDIVRAGKCLRERRVFGLITWSAVSC